MFDWRCSFFQQDKQWSAWHGHTLHPCAHKLYKYQKCVYTKNCIMGKIKNKKHAIKLQHKKFDKIHKGIFVIFLCPAFLCFYTAHKLHNFDSSFKAWLYTSLSFVARFVKETKFKTGRYSGYKSFRILSSSQKVFLLNNCSKRSPLFISNYKYSLSIWSLFFNS